LKAQYLLIVKVHSETKLMQAINQKIHLILVLHKSTQATKNIKKMPIDSHAESQADKLERTTTVQ
jgi:hypothetical protein